MIAHFAQAVIALMLWVAFFVFAGSIFHVEHDRAVVRFWARAILLVPAAFFGYGAFELTKIALGV